MIGVVATQGLPKDFTHPIQTIRSDRDKLINHLVMRTVGSWFKLLLVGADGMIGTGKNDLFHSCLPSRLKHMIRPDDIIVQHSFPRGIDSRARSQVHHTLHPLESRDQCLHTFCNIDNESLLARNWLE